MTLPDDDGGIEERADLFRWSYMLNESHELVYIVYFRRSSCPTTNTMQGPFDPTR